MDPSLTDDAPWIVSNPAEIARLEREADLVRKKLSTGELVLDDQNVARYPSGEMFEYLNPPPTS